MAQQSEGLYDNMPCPQCGSQHLIQHVNQSEDVYIDSDGQLEGIEPRDSVDVRELWCPECDEKIWEAED